jgi:hypothetical protein
LCCHAISLWMRPMPSCPFDSLSRRVSTIQVLATCDHCPWWIRWFSCEWLKIMSNRYINSSLMVRRRQWKTPKSVWSRPICLSQWIGHVLNGRKCDYSVIRIGIKSLTIKISMKWAKSMERLSSRIWPEYLYAIPGRMTETFVEILLQGWHMSFMSFYHCYDPHDAWNLRCERAILDRLL